MCSVFGLLMLVVSLLFSIDIDITRGAALFIATVCAIVLLVLLAFPALLVTVLIVSGIRLIRHEGARPGNLLSLCLGILLVAYFSSRSSRSSQPDSLGPSVCYGSARIITARGGSDIH